MKIPQRAVYTLSMEKTLHIFAALDEGDIAKDMVTTILHAGHTIDTLHNGDMALQFIMDNYPAYDVIVLDARLPIKNGHEIYAKMRECHIDTPVLMLVTKEDIRHQSSDSNGAMDYLVKPFSSEELLLRMSQLAVRSVRFAPAVLSHGNVHLNVREQTLSKGSSVVHLTPKETALLEYFMTRPGAIVGRRELFVAVWGEGLLFASNVVDAHIKNVRKKIRDITKQGAAFQIETIRRLGYCLT